MLKRILVPLDGSERAERGLAVAARLAQGSGSELLIVRVVSVPNLRFAPYGEPAQIALALIATAHEEADDYLKRVSKSPEVEDISVVTRAVEGHVTADILDMARDEQCDLIVICTHGHTGFRRWRLGRVATHVARHAPVPVLIIPAHDAQPPASAADTDIRILVTLDSSELAEAAIPPALDLVHALAAPERVTVHLLQVVDFFTALMADANHNKTATSPAIGAEEHALEVARAYLKGLADRIQRENPGMTVTSTAILAADVAEMIGEIAEEGQPRYDYLAMATHGRGGLQRWALGSITERVLQSTQLPLLIARSPVAIAHDNEIADAAADAELHG
jgi:nucleotide-binding universal stress UspA family protein